MGSVFDSIKRTARSGRLRTELMLLDREVRQRQEAFGVQLYDYLEPLSKNPSFFSSDDRLTRVLRPALLEAQREIAVVYIKQAQLKEQVKQAEVKRAAAFPKKAETWQEKLNNAAKSTSLAGGEAKLKAEEIVLDSQLKAHKQQFGVKLYGTLEGLEDQENWLPTDREVRSIYDACRKDIEGMRQKAKEKMQELETLGVLRMESEKGQHEQGENNAAPTPATLAPVVETPKQHPHASLPPTQSQPGFTAPETPVLAHAATTAPAPVSAPPKFVGAPAPTSMSSVGGQTMGGVQPGETQSMRSFNTGGFSSSNQSQIMVETQTNNTNNFADFSDHSHSNSGSYGGVFGTAVGSNPGMGTGGFQQQPQQDNNPWGDQDPFASFAPAPTAPPPLQQHQQQHPNSNLLLY